MEKVFDAEPGTYYTTLLRASQRSIEPAFHVCQSMPDVIVDLKGQGVAMGRH